MKAALQGEPLPPDSREKTKIDGSTPLSKTVSARLPGIILPLPVIGKYFNRFITNKASTAGKNRPNQFSCKSGYTSYESLTDYSYYGRHLPPNDQAEAGYRPPELLNADLFQMGHKEGEPPALSRVLELFERKKDSDGREQVMCPRSTMLFPTFAQHLIDSFIVTQVKKDTPDGGTEFDWQRTDTPHDIGLLPLYGRTFDQTRQLRLCSERPGDKGRLKSQIINGEEWAPYLYDADGKVKNEFDKLDLPQGLEQVFKFDQDAQKKRKAIFAFGGTRTNLTPNISAWNTLLLREHNRVAAIIEKNNDPSWDDERVFQVARNVVLVIYLKLVVEEYINHITAYKTDFTVEPGKWMWNAPWYKRNWISAEFAVLYRWHAIIPNRMQWGEKTPRTEQSLFDNTLLLSEEGMKGNLRDIFYNICNHRASCMQLHNTEKWMIGRDRRALEHSRAVNLQSFSSYCEYLGRDVPQAFSDITKDKELQDELKDVYGDVKNVEFWVGLIAQDHTPESIMSPTLTQFVANDAFNQALAHPLLSENVWTNGEDTFSKVGFKIVKENQTIKDILKRNSQNGAKLEGFVGMTNKDYTLPSDAIIRIGLASVVVGIVSILVKLII